MSLVASTLIELRETRRGELRAFIAGTRISAQDIYIAHELIGQTPDEIIAAYPHLSLAQVHGALAYCFEHLDEVRRQLQTDQDFVDEIKARTGPGPLARKLNRQEGHGNSVEINGRDNLAPETGSANFGSSPRDDRGAVSGG